jgi:hypothetical protein
MRIEVAVIPVTGGYFICGGIEMRERIPDRGWRTEAAPLRRSVS